MEDLLIGTVTEDPGWYGQLMEQYLEGDIDFNSAGFIASAEVVSFHLLYPEVFLCFPGIAVTPLYRFLRAAELTYSVKRGGDVLLIGSGITVNEVAAQFLVPPDPEIVMQVLRVIHDFWKSDGFRGWDTLDVPSIPESPPLKFLDGQAVAIDPDPYIVRDLPDHLRRMRIPKGLVDLRSQTLGEFLGRKVSPGDYDAIIWNRADPIVVTSKYSEVGRILQSGNQPSPREKKAVTEATWKLFQRLIRGIQQRNGHMICTVGVGDNDDDTKSREALVKVLRSLLGQKFLVPDLELKEHLQQLLFGGDFGLYDGLVVLPKGMKSR